jgi:prolipoprotein diacylglyceryl transferase
MHSLASYIPSPSQGVWWLGPIPLRAYALIILLGIGVAIRVGNKRWIERGGLENQVLDIAMWAVPFGVIGGRIYHVLTDWSSYFSENGKGFIAALQIWQGGLGIWGAIALGGVGVYIASVRNNISFAPLADALAPGIVLAQAIGRWGNWFNQELFGRPTTMPWGLEISAVHRPVGYEEFEVFHPTFLYESIACVAIAFIVIWADKRFTMGHGRVFALYVALYCSARGAIETLRIDEANQFLGIRINVFTSLIIGAGALMYLILSGERHPGREELFEGQVLTARGKRERSRVAEAEVAQVKATELANEQTQAIQTPHRRDRRKDSRRAEQEVAAQPTEVIKQVKDEFDEVFVSPETATQITQVIPEQVESTKATTDEALTQAMARVLDLVTEPSPQEAERSKERGRRRKK